MLMDIQRSACSNNYIYHHKNMEDVREALLLTMELQRIKEQLRLKDLEISQLRQMVTAAITDRNEAQDKYQKLLLNQTSGISSIEDDPITAFDSVNGFSSSDCDESIVSSAPPRDIPVALTKPLPEKGKFLEAVVKAGPLLQNLLLAGGPLPQWRHPPPPIDSYQIPPPPVVIPPMPSRLLLQSNDCCVINKKRGLSEGGSESGGEFKHHRVVLR